MMGKLFTSADLDALIALYSFYALTPHYIITVVSYCISIGRSSMAYAEKVAASWIGEGIDDEGVTAILMPSPSAAATKAGSAPRSGSATAA